MIQVDGFINKAKRKNKKNNNNNKNKKKGDGDSAALLCPQVTQEQTVEGRKGWRTRPGKGKRSLKAVEMEKNCKQTETDPDSPLSPLPNTDQSDSTS